MRRFAVAVFLLAGAISASAQFLADSQFRIEKPDGTEISMPAMPAPTNGVIVEFVAPPAAISAGKSIAGYQATFARFRNDLGTILNGERAGKTADGIEIRRQYFVVFNGVALDVPHEAIARIRALPYVKRVVADAPMHAMADSANITIIKADKVWSTLGSRGKGVTVAIIDTGIDYNHPALGGGFGPGFKVAGGWDFVNNDADPFDDNGHGTHVAGIVAGQSDTITGVAPEATLLAYKVLGANGRGSESNVIAAIERAVDPNRDGNTSDHADVANLSLGGDGNPDDPGSVAIDNATVAGVTFAIAAGNNGSTATGVTVFHSISSPGTARRAITVGASDFGDKITSFSSRGPNMKNIAIKPDVIAPGLAILSSYPGNRYATLSGTSMASPHVAGAAALLKSLHHDWTPAQIKLALMNNATLLADDIMAGGAGRIDVLAAANGTLAIDPASISLGLAPLQLSKWTAQRTLHLTNRGAQAVTYNVKSNVVLGETVTGPASVTIPAGGAADLSLTFAVDNTIMIPAPLSFTGGGQIVLTNTAAPTDIRNVQFSFTKAARATVTFDRAYPDAVWLSSGKTDSVRSTYLDDNTSEVLTLPGTWDMLLFTTEFDEKTVAVTAADFIARDALALNSDVTIALTAADVPHVITLGGRRETGQPLDGAGFASGGRLLIPVTPTANLAFSILWTPVHTLHVSDIAASKTLLFYEALLDTAGSNYYVIQHPPLVGVTADAILTTGGSALRGGNVKLAVPPSSRSDHRLTALVSTANGSSGLPSVIGIVDGPAANARVFVSPDVHPNYTYGLVFGAFTDGVSQYTTPLLRVSDDRLVSLTAAGLLPWTYSGSTYGFGLGPRFPTSVVNPTGALSTPTLKATVAVEMLGPLGEVRVADRPGTAVALYDAAGTQLITGGNSTVVDVTTKGPYRIEVTNHGTLVPGVSKLTMVSMAIDSSRADYVPPTLTTMLLLDGSGTIVSRLEPHGTGALLFSAADYTPGSGGGRSYHQISSDATKVSYRYSGEAAWRPLSATQVVEDSSSGANSAGLLYRVDLAAATNIDRGLVDLKFDLADLAGNTTTVTMAPAFSIGPEQLLRRRATR
jgi:subtilisin family serine protease